MHHKTHFKQMCVCDCGCVYKVSWSIYKDAFDHHSSKTWGHPGWVGSRGMVTVYGVQCLMLQENLVLTACACVCVQRAGQEQTGCMRTCT